MCIAILSVQQDARRRAPAPNQPQCKHPPNASNQITDTLGRFTPISPAHSPSFASYMRPNLGPSLTAITTQSPKANRFDTGRDDLFWRNRSSPEDQGGPKREMMGGLASDQEANTLKQVGEKEYVVGKKKTLNDASLEQEEQEKQ